MDEERAADILEWMSPDEAADVLGDLPEEKAEDLLEPMEDEEQADVAELLALRRRHGGRPDDDRVCHSAARADGRRSARATARDGRNAEHDLLPLRRRGRRVVETGRA